MLSFLKKFVALLTLLTVLMPASLVFEPTGLKTNTANAQVLVTVAGGTLPGIESLLAAILGVNKAKTALSFKEWSMRFLRETIRKRLLDTMVDQIIGWVNGEGDPKFVTDWAQFLEDAAGVAVGDLAKELDLGFLCQPFSAQLRLALAPVRRFRNEITCTLDDITGNIARFYDDFSSGGWIAYTESWSPQNNVWGAYIIAAEEQERRASKAREAALEEARSGSGYLGVKSCAEVTGGTSADIDHDGIFGDVASSCTITLPSDSVAHLAAQAVSIDIPYLLSAQEMERYLAEIVNALFNRLIRSGVEGLGGLSSHSNPGADFDSPSADPCLGLFGADKTACEQYNGGVTASFQDARANLISDIDTALNTRLTISDLLSDLIQRAENYQTFLNQTDLTRPSCVSDAQKQVVATRLADWQARLQVNQAAVTALQQARAKLLGLAIDDWTEYTKLSSEISAEVSAEAASAAKAQAEAEQKELFGGAGLFTRARREIEACAR